MSQNLKTKTNEELIKLISEAAAELEWRRKANKAANTQENSNDELGSIPDSPPPPPPPHP